MRRAIFYAILGAVAAILNALAITEPIVDTVTHGGPAWLAWFLFTPFLLFAAGLAAGAHAEHVHYNAKQAPAVPEWHVWDEELPAELSDAERAMLRRNAGEEAHFADAAKILSEVRKPWPHNLAGKPAVLTDDKDQT